jgi:hypothetical protein
MDTLAALSERFADWLRDDPITQQQVRVFEQMIGSELSACAFEGFLIVASRLVTEWGEHRTEDFAVVFQTSTPTGRRVLRESLEDICLTTGGLSGFIDRWPVTINPSLPAYPMLRIAQYERVTPFLFRVMHSEQRMRDTGELIAEYIKRTGCLPRRPVYTEPVLREKPKLHWCSNEAPASPDAARERLQILPEWGNNCFLVATISVSSLPDSAFVAFNGDERDPTDPNLKFYKYFYEPLACDHPPLLGGGVQVGLDGSPPVDRLHVWDEDHSTWSELWRR